MSLVLDLGALLQLSGTIPTVAGETERSRGAGAARSKVTLLIVGDLLDKVIHGGGVKVESLRSSGSVHQLRCGRGRRPNVWRVASARDRGTLLAFEVGRLHSSSRCVDRARGE